ncbi:MAG TPA: hydroxymethylbilane synthase [Actinobacteria bacterium]|nr:hydroxymethylbilane synthase [Actinomycetota bacterium]
MTELVLATRGSPLALAQARLVAAAIEERRPDVAIRLLVVTTTGDRDRTTPVTALTELGAFVRAVQAAVLAGEADLAVHSAKDLPVDGSDRLVAYHPARADAADALVGVSLDDLADRARVGTGSPRREAQLRILRPQVEVVPIRGNVDTRVGLVGSSVDAVVLAVAGLERVGLSDRIAHRFELDEMVPAPAQGALTVEVLPGTFAEEVAASLADPDTTRAVATERALLEITGAGCRAALGAHAVTDDDRISLHVFVSDDRGPRRTVVVGSDPLDVAQAAAKELGL